MAYQFLRGDTAANDAYTGPLGSLTIDTQAGTIRVHDGATAGGFITIEDIASIQAIIDALAVADINGLQAALDEKAALAGGVDANFTLMPQFGGNPIVESGSNANGEFTRWADGTQISKSTLSGIDVTTDRNSGSYFQSTPATFTRPVTFTEIFVEHAEDASSSNLWGSVAGGQVVLFFHSSVTGRTAEITTWGRWF